MSNSTTEFVDYFDPEKQVTKVTIVGGSQKPITEYVNRKNRLENNMFLSGYTTRPAGADRFQKMEESQVITTKTTTIIGEPQVRVKETLNTSNNVMNQSQSLGYNMADSNVMSTSTYIGNVVTNRVANMNRAANTSQRSSNVMYHSQTFRVGENRSANKNFKHDMKLFTVPDKVQNFINNCQNEIKYVERDVMAEKSKMNAELDVMQQTIQFIIEKKRAELNSMYDGYLQGFRTNVEVLKSKAVSFKDTTDWVKMQNSENGDRLVRLTDIAYYSKGTDGIYHHYRKDAHKSICELRNLKQEVNKHNLDFYVAELERMGIHHPAFANTASSAEYLAEVKANLFKNVQTGFDDFGKLAYTAQHVLFSEILAEPQIFTSLGESRLNCLTNMRDLSSNSVISSRMAPLSHTQPITTLMNVDDESLATGDMEGTINIFNHLLWKETHKFKMNGVSPITSLGRIRTTYELVSGGEQMIHSENEIKEKHDKNIFLISGHAKPDCVITIWDMKRQCFVKQLTGHTDDVTSISSLQDGHTIISGSMAGTTHIFSITKKKPIKSFQSLVNSPVNVIYTFNDLAKFAIGYDNGEVTICSILYEIHPIEKMAICASADPVGTLKAKSPVLCINESHTNPNTIITGHEDKIVRIWDSASQQIMKELSSNLTPVISTLVIENPFSFNLEENYHIISCGENQDDIYFNLPKHNKQFQLRFEMGIDLRGTKGRNPKVQLYREKKEESEQGINFATFINGADNSRQIALITIR
jgi:WD40 repeat protein